jgi:acetyl-CoA C-acetyltransferase
MDPIYILDAVRTPRGRAGQRGSLRGLTPIELLAGLAADLRDRHRLDTERIADAVIGCVGQVGDQGGNVGRLALLAAGWSDRCPVATINRFCASSLTATLMAGMRAGHDDALAVAGGVEMMSRVPLAADHGPITDDPAVPDAHGVVPIAICADAIATLGAIDRASCDAYAASSQQRAALARAEGRFASLVTVRDAGGRVVLAEDETIRPDASPERLARLPAAFAELGAAGADAVVARRTGLDRIEHVHHAGSAPALADGASLVLLASEGAARRAGLRPRARLVAGAEVGSDRTLALTGVVDATRRVLGRAGLGTGDIDLFEINESFAGVMIHVQRALGIDRERLNVNGGAIALGHALGATGAMLLGTALDELERRGGRRAVVAISGAAGLATAALIERVDP